MSTTPFDREALYNAIVDDLAWLPDGERSVLHVLFRHAGEDGKACPGQTLIAAKCGCNRGTVSRRLARLVEWDILEIVRRGNAGSRIPTVYRILPSSKWPTGTPVAGVFND